MATRTQVAQFVANKIQSGKPAERKMAVLQAAEWLKINGKQRQSEYLVKDIAIFLKNDGYLYTKITTAKPLSETTKNKIKEYLIAVNKVDSVEIDEFVDPDIIGGIKIETPYGLLDTSVKARLAKIVGGAN
mgnify:CR=1 FL=1